MTKMCLLATVALAGCSAILGFKEPRVEDNTPIDAAVDAPPDTVNCSTCQFGCDPITNTCRDGKLWIYKTQGAFLGNAFGGTDNPPNVRGGADGKCLATYSALYTGRQCNTNRLHAVLYVSSTDSIALMATKYGIPTNVPVHRAEDDVLVSNNWNDLTDPTKTLRAPASTAATDAAGSIWTGTNTSATCTGWTTAVSTDSGTRGFANRTDVTWLSAGTLTCDRGSGLLCICWSGGN